MTKKALNVKPGDRAIVERPGQYGHGWTLTVLERAPKERFLLPDGQPNIGAGDKVKWVVKTDKPALVQIMMFGYVARTRETVYGVVRDEWLRPIASKEQS